MNEIGWGKHALILVSMLIVLWAGGDYIDQWFGHVARSIAELLLILWYLTAIIGMRPFRPGQNPWRRRNDDDDPH